jgi:hypothetical protein
MILKTNKEKKWEARLDNATAFFETMQKWAKAQEFGTWPRVVMPYDIFVLKEDGVDVFCVSLFVADHIGFTVFPLANKDKTHAKGGLSFLYEAVDFYCKTLKIKVLITTANPEEYKSFLRSNDWVDIKQYDEDYYIKILK